jgi:Protein of unknown function (DUF2971)
MGQVHSTQQQDDCGTASVYSCCGPYNTMPVTQSEISKYQAFVARVANDFGCLEKPKGLMWHYTDGEGLLGIIRSRSLRATQVAALNDKNETLFASSLFRKALERLKSNELDAESTTFLRYVLSQFNEDDDAPNHGGSLAYVCCFSGHEDELTQWERYGRQGQHFNWGYAVGFDGTLTGPLTALFKVIYDRKKQETAAEILAQATLDFYREGLVGDRVHNVDEWRQAFFTAWDLMIYPLAAAVKEAHWDRENEYRIYCDGRTVPADAFGFMQRNTMLSRYVSLHMPLEGETRAPLPIREIMIGPGNIVSFTKLNLELFLSQQEYPNITIRHSTVKLQNP